MLCLLWRKKEERCKLTLGDRQLCEQLCDFPPPYLPRVFDKRSFNHEGSQSCRRTATPQLTCYETTTNNNNQQPFANTTTANNKLKTNKHVLSTSAFAFGLGCGPVHCHRRGSGRSHSLWERSRRHVHDSGWNSHVYCRKSQEFCRHLFGTFNRTYTPLNE